MAAATARSRSKKRSLLDDVQEVGFTDAPTEDQSNKLSELGRQLLERDREIADLERRLSEARTARWKIASEDLPSYMESVGQNVIGLGDVEVVLEPFYHANISAEWPEERRQTAFDYLESVGAGGLIKLMLAYSFRRGELESARQVQFAIETVAEMINRIRAEAGIEEPFVLPEPTLREEVHHMTLTAWLKERVEAGSEVDLEVLGATVGRVAKVVRQKKRRR